MSAAPASLVRVGIGVAVVALLACLPLLNLSLPGVLPGATYQPGTLQLLALCLLIAALALSYHLLFGVAGLLSFGHALYFAAGLYGLGIALRHWQLSLATAVLVVLVATTVLALAVGAVSLRVSGISFAMVTLAFAQAGSVLVARNPGGITGGDEGLGLDVTSVPDLFVGVVNTRNLYWFTLVVLVIVYLVVLWVDTSRLGHLARATRENEQRVRVLGLRPYRAKLIVFVIAAVLASLAGVAYMLLQSGTVPRAVSADLTITILVMVVLGGVGFRWGAIVGGVLYTLLDQRLTVVAGSDVVAGLPDILRIPLSEPLFLLGVLFILVVMFLPGGIAGTIDAWWRRRRGERVRLSLQSMDDADADAEAPAEVRA